MDEYSIHELANEAQKRGINLGTNPERTIRYYINIGLLDKPSVVQSGKKRFSVFNKEHLFRLNLINHFKKHGYTLKEIKKDLEGRVYWTDYGLKFISSFKNEIPDHIFIKSKPITNEEMAFFTYKLLETEDIDSLQKINILCKSVVNSKGKPLKEIPLMISGGFSHWIQKQ